MEIFSSNRRSARLLVQVITGHGSTKNFFIENSRQTIISTAHEFRLASVGHRANQLVEREKVRVKTTR